MRDEDLFHDDEFNSQFNEKPIKTDDASKQNKVLIDNFCRDSSDHISRQICEII